MEQLPAAERRLGAVPDYLTASGRFAHLLEALHRQTGQRVVVPVDEYDKPILDVLEEPEVALTNRDYLRGLYGVMKDNDAHVRFTFLTGISKFSKVNLCSQLNAGLGPADGQHPAPGAADGSARLRRPQGAVPRLLRQYLVPKWYTNNDIADHEGFYASVFYSYFAALGYDVTVESSSHGRLDMAVRAAGHVYLFEFKVAEMAPPGSALAQLQERRYADKYRATGEPVHLVGVEFSRASRNVTAYEVADA